MCVVYARLRLEGDKLQEAMSAPMPRPWCEHYLRLLREKYAAIIDRLDLQVRPI